MIVTFWLDGEKLHVGDRFSTSEAQFVVAERWFATSGWHVVLRHPQTPAEETPPWNRGKGEG
jgi:hypothetical protein